jgi:putative transposase
VIKLQYRSPNTNAYVERFIQTLQQECLDYFIVFGERHMDYLVREMVEHYHMERPHQSKGNQPLLYFQSPGVAVSVTDPRHKRTRTPAVRDPIVCAQRLGGLLKHYRYRRAA